MVIKISKTTPDTPDTPATPEAKKPAGVGVTYLFTGAAAKKRLEAAEAQSLANSGAWRFRISQKNLGQDFQICFLDGDLDESGSLSHGGTCSEHTIQHANRWKNFVCTESVGDDAAEPCPMCASGDAASMVTFLSVMDMNEYEKKDGTKSAPARKLLAFKQGTLKLLDKMARKRGGLRGCVFDVSRTGNKSAAVGDVYDFVQKLSPDEMAQMFKDQAKPLVYTDEIKYHTAAELAAMGIGTVVQTIGSTATQDLDGEL